MAEIANVGLDSKLLSQTQALATQAYQLSGSSTGVPVISAQGISRSHPNTVMMQQSSSQTKYLNMPQGKHSGQPPMLNSVQTHRYSLEKLKEFESKLLQQSANNSSSKHMLSQERKQMNFAELADSTIYGVPKHSVLLPSSKHINADNETEAAAVTSTTSAPHRTEDRGMQRMGTRNSALVSFTGGQPQGGSEPARQ